MDALLPTFLAAALAEIGDKTQLLAVLLAAHFRRPRLVLGGIGLAALANSLIAAIAGTLLHDLVNFRAIALMTALALLFAGGGALLRARPPVLTAYDRLGPFVASAFAFFVLEFGDKTQFLTMTLAARADSVWLAAFGATAGVVLASAPVVILGPRLAALAPIRGVRIGIALVFLLTGFIVAVNALRLT